MKRLALALFASTLFAVGFVACSSAPQYEGGGRHLDNEIVTGSSTGSDAASPPDTSIPDTSVVKDTSVPDTSVGPG